MLIRTLAFLTGIIALTFQSELIPIAVVFTFVLLTPLLLFKKFYITLPLIICAGFLWATFVAHHYLETKIPNQLEGKNILISGIIRSIPEKIGRRTRFEMSLNSVSYENKKYKTPKKIKLNWYGATSKLIPGDKWQLVVRLKKPFSYQNPGGFDYEGWMFQNQIDAKGYVRKSNLNKILQSNQSLISFTRIRYFLKKEIKAIVQTPYRPIILALLIGDKSEISSEQWSIFRKTGTSHLIAISGLHIGLIAGLVFFMTRWLWGFYKNGAEIIPSPKIAAIFAILSAVIYSAMAGFSLPTQRALIMLCVIMISILIDVRAQSWKTLAIALLLVLILSPFAVMNPGFWLSFFAVAIILYFSKMARTKRKVIASTMYNWGLIQVVIGFGLMPFVLLFFNESSIISPIANFVVVPVFSFIIVPIIFIAGCFIFIAPSLSGMLFAIVIFVLDKVWVFLEYLAKLSFSTVQINNITFLIFIFSIIGILLLFLPKKFPSKLLAPIFFLPLFFSKFDRPDFGSAKITLLDVGQGLSVVIQTQYHVLVYDTGPRYSKSFNTGKTVVLPYLQSIGISNIDKIVISHGDNDHIGGIKSIVDTITVRTILTSVPDKVKLKIKPKNQIITIKTCDNKMRWSWDGVDFSLIHPEPSTALRKNNASCVLRVSTKTIGQRKNKYQNAILLTGDIEAKAELKIINNETLDISANILIAPHHGSITSSTKSFIKKINPDFVLYPVGYRNRYHFPSNIVSERYKKLGIKSYSTSEYGAITFNLNSFKIKKPELYRVSYGRFWHN